MELKIIDTTQGKLEYSIHGEGEPILIMHGGHSNAKDTLGQKHLSPDEFIFITPSRPGYGNTTLADNQSPETAAAQFIELMDHLKIRRFSVMGISAGGLSAIALASNYPDRVKKLVLASSISKRWLYPDEALYKRARRMFHPGVEQYTWAILRFFINIIPRRIVKTMLSELTTVAVSKLDKTVVDEMTAILTHQGSKKGFVTDLEHDLDASVIKNIKVPTLIVHSKHDKAVPTEHPLHAKEQIPYARLLWVDNQWGHMIWMGAKSKEPIDHVRAFLIE